MNTPCLFHNRLHYFIKILVWGSVSARKADYATLHRTLQSTPETHFVSNSCFVDEYSQDLVNT